MSSPKKVEVPVAAAGVLTVLDSRVRLLQAAIQTNQSELAATIAAGQAYATSIGLNPSVSYLFEPEGDKMFAHPQKETK